MLLAFYPQNRSVISFFALGNDEATPENQLILRFYTVWGNCRLLTAILIAVIPQRVVCELEFAPCRV